MSLALQFGHSVQHVCTSQRFRSIIDDWFRLVFFGNPVNHLTSAELIEINETKATFLRGWESEWWCTTVAVTRQQAMACRACRLKHCSQFALLLLTVSKQWVLIFLGGTIQCIGDTSDGVMCASLRLKRKEVQLSHKELFSSLGYSLLRSVTEVFWSLFFRTIESDFKSAIGDSLMHN